MACDIEKKTIRLGLDTLNIFYQLCVTQCYIPLDRKKIIEEFITTKLWALDIEIIPESLFMEDYSVICTLWKCK